MQRTLIVFFFILIANGVVAQTDKLPVDKILQEGQKIEVLLSSEIVRVAITLQNQLDGESIIYHTMFIKGSERPENEIGPKSYRTVTLAPKVADKNEPIRRDRKELVLNTGGADKLVFRIEKRRG